MSDSSTQENNRAMLEAMFKKERKRRNREKQDSDEQGDI
jgi:hypothetical protein